MARDLGGAFRQLALPEEIDAFTPLGYQPHEKQQLFHKMSKERVNAILFGGAAGGGKLLSLDELVPTPGGFVRVGDLHSGDHVFGADGILYPVLAESEVQYEAGYRFVFDDGSTAVSHDGHLWKTFTQRELQSLTRRQVLPPPEGTVRTTAEIVATLRVGPNNRTNHAIQTCLPLQMADTHLPLDPYVLGVWLGDGAKAGGRITTMDPEIVWGVEEAGFDVSSTYQQPGNRSRDYNFRGLVTDLRSAGVLGNKHIPEQYFWASSDQRLALLQGLMDTDGDCILSGAAGFTNTNQLLTDGVARLARSLGIKVRVREGRAKMCGVDFGPKWSVKFTTSIPVFRLERKLTRQKAETRQTTRFRYIVDAERVPIQPMKCFQVGSPDNLFLITEHFIPTHNTAASLLDAIHHSCNIPGIQIACVRRSYPELEESFFKELRKRQYCRPLESVFKGQAPKWNVTEKRLFFPNGSIINFTYAETEVDASRLQGGEYQVIYVDEASLMLPEVLGMVCERLRSGERGIPVIGLRFSTNPGGVGSKDLKDRFVTPTNWGELGVVPEHDDDGDPILDNDGNPSTVAYIQSRFDDNPYLDAGYEKLVLNRIADPNRRKAMRDGDWDAMVGAFFPQWQRVRHVVPAFRPPKEWQRYCGIDYGIREPFAAEWAAVDNDGRLWFYREITIADLEAKDQARAILEAEKAAGEQDIMRVADPSMWGDRGTPLSIADIYGIEGCGIAKADNNRLNGYARFHALLNDGPACDYHRQFGIEVCPMMHVMEPHDELPGCEHLIDDIPNLPRSKTKPEDSETRGVRDHTIDAARYLIAMAGSTARPVMNEAPTDKAQALEDEVAAAHRVPAPPNHKLVAGLYAGNLAPTYEY